VGRRLAPEHGGLGTIAAKTDDGILVINPWETEEGRHAMAEEPEVLEALQSAGLPMPAFEGLRGSRHADPAGGRAGLAACTSAPSSSSPR
jgi:hypothetical protein